MRVVCACLPGYGHLHPMVPLARALTAAGHDVAFATERRFCLRAERAGFRAFPAGIGSGRVFERTLARPDAAPPDDPWRFGAQMFAAVAAPAKAADLVGIVERWRADLVVHDVTDFAGPIAAAHGGIPSVAHGLGPLFPIEFFRLAAELVARAWLEWDLPPPSLGGLFGAAYLDVCPPRLQSATLAEIAPVTHPLRPVPFDAVEGEHLPAWADRLDPRPTVYVTLGTVDNGAPGVIEAAVAGLREEPVNLVVSVGPDRDPAELGPQPPHVRVERYVPQSLLFPRCDVVVTHGGSGTVLAALAHGLPLLVLPQGANQFWNADRCVELGVGLRLAAGDVSPDAIRDRVETLLGVRAFRDAAVGMAAEIAAMPGPDEAVGLLEALAATGPPCHTGR